MQIKKIRVPSGLIKMIEKRVRILEFSSHITCTINSTILHILFF